MREYLRQHSRLTNVLMVVVFWAGFSSMFYVSLREGEHRILVSILAFPAMSLFMAVFACTYSFFFDFLPGWITNKWCGPPWRTPRKVSPFSEQKLIRQYHEQLQQRLDVVTRNIGTGTTLYRDRHTGQEWICQYTQYGSGDGDVLSPATKTRGET